MHSRKIIHIDMDAFYASIEQRDKPDLQGKPVAVGSDSERGVISAASYEARKFGVRSAMSSVIAKRMCPELVFVKGNMKKYKEVSRQIMEVFKEYTDLVEPLSIDEAFLDVTYNKLEIESASEIASQIKAKIKERTQLTASAGISINKFLAKIASDMNKPDGLYTIPPDKAEAFIEKLTVEKFFGIGKVTANKLHKVGIHTGADLKKLSIEELKRFFGKNGRFFYDIVRGIDQREVNPNRERKSVGTEYTFDKDLTDKISLIVELYKIEKEQFERMKKNNFIAYTLTLKIKYADFTQITRSITSPHPIGTFDELHRLSKMLLNSVNTKDKPVRLMGVSVSKTEKEDNGNKSIQLTLDF